MMERQRKQKKKRKNAIKFKDTPTNKPFIQKEELKIENKNNKKHRITELNKNNCMELHNKE
jgi:hypothetical protein